MQSLPAPTPDSMELLITLVKSMGTILAGAVGIILALVGVIYHNQKEMNKTFQEQIAESDDQLANNTADIGKLQQAIAEGRAYHVRDMETQVAMLKGLIKGHSELSAKDFLAIKESIRVLENRIITLDANVKQDHDVITTIQADHKRNHP